MFYNKILVDLEENNIDQFRTKNNINIYLFTQVIYLYLRKQKCANGVRCNF